MLSQVLHLQLHAASPRLGARRKHVTPERCVSTMHEVHRQRSAGRMVFTTLLTRQLQNTEYADTMFAVTRYAVRSLVVRAAVFQNRGTGPECSGIADVCIACYFVIAFAGH